MTTGEQLKLDGIERVANHNANWHEWAVVEIKRLCNVFTEVSSDDLRVSMSVERRLHCHPNAIGAAFNAASRSGLIKVKGFRKSVLPSTHARRILVWEKA